MWKLILYMQKRCVPGNDCGTQRFTVVDGELAVRRPGGRFPVPERAAFWSGPYNGAGRITERAALRSGPHYERAAGYRLFKTAGIL